MNAADVVGYTSDGAAFCLRCWGSEAEPLEGNGGPVFAQDADDLTCHDCGESLDSRSLTDFARPVKALSKPKTTDQTIHSLLQVGSTAFTVRRLNGVPFGAGTEVKVTAVGEVRAEWQSQRYQVARAESRGAGSFWVYGDDLVDEKPQDC